MCPGASVTGLRTGTFNGVRPYHPTWRGTILVVVLCVSGTLLPRLKGIVRLEYCLPTVLPTPRDVVS